GSGPSARAVSNTQSTSRLPSSGCRCFGVSERIRVPRPAAMTTVASFRAVKRKMAGAPGFEPGIAGPKPAALPLGYAPPENSVTAGLEPSRPTQRDGGRAGKAATGLMVGAATTALEPSRPTQRDGGRAGKA